MRIILLLITSLFSLSVTFAQNVGIGQPAPASKIDVNGGVSIGAGYSGVNAAPANGAIIQGQIGIGTAAPGSSAAINTASTSQGILYPRMTTAQRNAIASPATGLEIFNTSTNCLEAYINASWQAMACGCTSPPAAPAIYGTFTGLCKTPSSFAYYSPSVYGATGYTWSVTGDPSPTIAGQGTNTVTVTYSTTAASAINCYATNPCGNSSATSQPLTFATASGPAITGYTVVGAAQTNVVYSVPSGLGTYAWSVTGTGTGAISGSSTGSAVTVSWSGTVGTSAANTINVSVTSCAGVASNSVTVAAGGNKTFAYTGSLQAWGGANYDVTSMSVQLWGAGGGGNNECGGLGGGGAYLAGTLAVPTIPTSISVLVGQGGTFLGTASYGGGGQGVDDGIYTATGSGGGYSGITSGSDRLIAGGGGGGGDDYDATLGSGYANGGGGGGTTGGGAGVTSDICPSEGGGGGNNTSGGAGGIAGCDGSAYNGLAGSSLTGANASLVIYGGPGGGGGGGYYGGGSGASDYGGGGGGGSSYPTAGTSDFTLTTLTAGTTASPASSYICATTGGPASGGAGAAHIPSASIGMGGSYYNTGARYYGGNGAVYIAW
jgi:hypothetical protein